MSQRQAPPDKSTKVAGKRSCRSLQVSTTRQLDSADSELDCSLIDIDTLRKAELVRRRALGEHVTPDDPQSLFDWGL